MARPNPAASKKEKNKTLRWVITIFFVTIFVSGLISLISDEILEKSGMAAAFLILLAIVLVGIIFDIIGVAVTSADEKPFHSMAARKVPGAQESIMLLRNAERVSSICNDVVGDICGVVSGAAAATISVQVLGDFDFTWPKAVPLIMSAFVAGLTVGGKAVGKAFAIDSCVQIVHGVGKVIFWLGHLPMLFRRKKK